MILFFLDPPYDTKFTKYGNDVDFNKDNHVELAEEFKKLKCKIMIVIGKNAIHWRTI